MLYIIGFLSLRIFWGLSGGHRRFFINPHPYSPINLRPGSHPIRNGAKLSNCLKQLIQFCLTIRKTALWRIVQTLLTCKNLDFTLF